MKRIALRVSDLLDQQIKDESKLRGLTQTDLILKALEHFLTCQKAEGEPSLKEIINAYENVFCSYCDDTIPIGQRCLWGKGKTGITIYVCSNCELIETETDRTIAKRVIKRRVLERQIKALENQLDQRASEFEASDLIEKEQDALKLFYEMHKAFMELQSVIEYNKAVKGSMATDQLLNGIGNIIQFSERCIVYLKDFDSFREKYLKVKATKRETVKA